MIPASLISTYLQIPLTDIHSYSNGLFWTRKGKKNNLDKDKKLNILLVDDTIHTGGSMNSAYNEIKSLYNNNIIRFAVYSSADTKNEDIDFVCELCPGPRVFSWNIAKHHLWRNWGTDLDGVLCRDPSAKERSDDTTLFNFYQSADLRFPILREIKLIVTSRREKFRNVTENWLKQNEISYQQLVMKPDVDINKKHHLYKFEILKNAKLDLYVESEEKQARFISENANLLVWCTDTQKYFIPKK
jgi:uncharacterized HAD superfamily protein